MIHYMVTDYDRHGNASRWERIAGPSAHPGVLRLSYADDGLRVWEPVALERAAPNGSWVVELGGLSS